MIEPNNFLLSVKRQCELLDISRASFYYEAEPISKVKQELLDVVDEAYTRHPYFGHRRMIAYLSQMERPITQGHLMKIVPAGDILIQIHLKCRHPKRTFFLAL